MPSFYSSLNHIFNIAGAAVIGTALSPLFLAAVAVSIVEHRKNPIITQKRIGKDGQPFSMYKIRTMTDQKEKDGTLCSDEIRTPWMSKISRKLKADEIPQMLNILKREMNLVGPRAMLPHTSAAQDTLRHTVRPGWTSLFELMSRDLKTEKMRLLADHTYVYSQSLSGDLEIIAQTPLGIVKNMFGAHFSEEGQLSNVKGGAKPPEI